MTECDKIRSEKWFVYDPHKSTGVGPNGRYCEDLSIFTEGGNEVVGCSEWMRAEQDIFQYIVKLHNENITFGRGEK
jgi:hypothetical protein